MDIICETDGLKRFRFFSVEKDFYCLFVVKNKSELPNAVYACVYCIYVVKRTLDETDVII